MSIETIMRTSAVIPVLVIDDAATAKPLAEALVAGGLKVLEVTLRTPAALDAIREMKKVPGAIVGAGTVVNTDQFAQVMDAGGEFIVSPGLTDRLGQAIASAGREQGVAVAACSALRRCYRDRLRGTIDGSVRFVLLENSRDALLARIGNRPGHYMPASLLDSQLATLERPQPDEGAMLLRTDLPATLLCDLVLGALR